MYIVITQKFLKNPYLLYHKAYDLIVYYDGSYHKAVFIKYLLSISDIQESKDSQLKWGYKCTST